MAGAYETWFKSPGLGPNWMHDAVGDAYWGSVGKMFDDQVSRMKTAVKARFPDFAAAGGMADALELQGKDRLLPRGGSTPGANDEALATWATRLKAAFSTWALAGSAKGLLTELKIQGFPGSGGTSICNHVGRRYYLDGSGDLVVTNPADVCVNRVALDGTLPSTRLHGFTLEGRDQFYSMFCVLFTVDVASLTNAAGNKPKAILNQTVARWRQGGAHYVGAAVIPPDAIGLGWPTGNLVGKAGLNFGANGVRFIDTE